MPGFVNWLRHGVDKPVLNVFRMFGMMQGERVMVKSETPLSAQDIIANGVREENDINAIASKEGNSAWIMVWNYHDDDIKGNSAIIELAMNDIDKNKVLVHHYRIDRQFSNSFEKWKSMGKPQDVSVQQYSELEQAGQLQLLTSPKWQEVVNGKTQLKFDLPRQAVSLIQLTW